MMGDHLGVITKLRSLVGAHPYRERLYEQLMVALHRAGRTAEALAAFQDIKRNLASDLGIDPGMGLLELQRRILNADPDLVDGAPRVALQFRS
jgi:DNA-binding SARP family transcriptional activator